MERGRWVGRSTRDEQSFGPIHVRMAPAHCRLGGRFLLPSAGRMHGVTCPCALRYRAELRDDLDRRDAIDSLGQDPCSRACSPGGIALDLHGRG